MTQNADITCGRSCDRGKARGRSASRAQGVVRAAQVRVFEHAVSFVQRLHPLLATAAVRMMLCCLPFELPLDLYLRSMLVDAQNPVVVFVRIELAHYGLPDSRGELFVWQCHPQIAQVLTNQSV